MNQSQNKKRGIMTIAICAIVFVAYNIILFAIAGFENHGPAFWISYVFMLLAFFIVMVSGLLVMGKKFQPKDWMLGYPILSHCVVYIIVETIVSTAFMLLELLIIPWGFSLAAQTLILAVHLVFNVSCFITKDALENIQANTKNKTLLIETLRTEVEMLEETAVDAEVKGAYHALAEELRYSDPVSSPMLFEVEQRLVTAVHQARPYVEANDKQMALDSCKSISLILSERNKKCKLYK